MTWTLHQGNCIAGMATLPDKSVDVVITDPPYSEHVHTKGKHTPKTHAVAGDTLRARDFGFDAITIEQIETCAAEFGRLAKRWVLAFCDQESAHLWREAYERHGIRYARTGLWIKTDGQPQITGDRPAAGAEAVVIGYAEGAGRWRWNGGGKPAVYPIGVERESRVHTSQKPLALMEALVRDFTDLGETILDPFAGSGTTGVAAIRLGRHFVGWEQDAKYHAIATKRLSEAREQLEIPTRKIKHKQTTLAGT